MRRKKQSMLTKEFRKEEKKYLSKWIKEIRLLAKLSQIQMGRLLGIGQSAYCRIESGQRLLKVEEYRFVATNF